MVKRIVIAVFVLVIGAFGYNATLLPKAPVFTGSLELQGERYAEFSFDNDTITHLDMNGTPITGVITRSYNSGGHMELQLIDGKHEKAVYYNEYDNPSLYVEYKNGELHGEMYSFDNDTSKVIKYANYINGKRDGWYSKDGHLVFTSQLENDEVTSSRLYLPFNIASVKLERNKQHAIILFFKIPMPMPK